MSHSRNPSNVSETSTSSYQGASNLNIISDNFGASVNANMAGPHSDDFLYNAALKQIQFLKVKPARFHATLSTVDPAIDPVRILEAMLKCSSICGGQRYTACCIVSCAENVEGLVELANTWIRYLLWPFKCNSDRRWVESSEHATPPAEDTATRLGSAAVHRRSAFPSEVLKRDGFRCVVTGLWHAGHLPPQSTQRRQVFLKAAHILKRGVGVFGEATLRAVSLTRDIIKQYSAIPDEMIDAMNELMDDPQNGIALQSDAHFAFDRLDFTLMPQDDGSYKIEQFGDHIVDPFQPTIRFHNYSSDPAIQLPNQRFLALHAAIASVLHMSGAGVILDSIMDKFTDAGTPVPSGKLRTAEDLDLLFASLSIK